MDFGPTVHVPHTLRLEGGRMLWWLHRASDDDVQRFMITTDDLTVDEGRALLTAARVGHDGRPIGPVEATTPKRTSAGDLSSNAGWRALHR